MCLVLTTLLLAASVDGAPSLSGPRLGATYVLSPSPKQLAAEYDMQPVLSQFGWQFERRFFERPGGFTGLNELVVLAGGLDQAKIMPTVSWVVGVRSQGGAEVGGGPVLSLAEMYKAMAEDRFGISKQRDLSGVGFAVAGGVTLHSGGVNFPFSLVF